MCLLHAESSHLAVLQVPPAPASRLQSPAPSSSAAAALTAAQPRPAGLPLHPAPSPVVAALLIGSLQSYLHVYDLVTSPSTLVLGQKALNEYISGLSSVFVPVSATAPAASHNLAPLTCRYLSEKLRSLPSFKRDLRQHVAAGAAELVACSLPGLIAGHVTTEGVRHEVYASGLTIAAAGRHPARHFPLVAQVKHPHSRVVILAAYFAGTL